MKKLLVLLTLALSAQAKAADFISIPFNCTGVLEEGTGKEVHLPINVDQHGVYYADLQDGNDMAYLICKKVPTDIPEYHNLECKGKWESDKSEALLSATLNTFVPFVTIQRSQTGFNAQKLTGICTR